jgi:hypothetical protein
MATQVTGVIGSLQTSSGLKQIFEILVRTPIVGLNLPKFPPSLPPLPIPTLPKLAAPSFGGLNFNPPKYNLGSQSASGVPTPPKFPTLTKPSVPNLGLKLPSFPPSLPPLPIPTLPKLTLPSFGGLNFNPPKYNLGSQTGSGVPTPPKFPTLTKPTAPNLGLKLPAFPPSLPPLPIPSLPKLPLPSAAAFLPYSSFKAPYNSIVVPQIKITQVSRIE